MKIGCPNCEEIIDVELDGDTELGDIIECPECGEEMEITDIRPDGTITVESTESDCEDNEFEEEEEDEDEDED